MTGKRRGAPAPERALRNIERQLARFDTEAASFDYEQAEECKAALVRIARAAADLCSAIKARPSRKLPQGHKWRFDHDRAARDAASKAGLLSLMKTEAVRVGKIKGGGVVTVPAGPLKIVRK